MAIKPTIGQYDRVYGGLRQNSTPNYDLLRTWILNPSSGGDVVDITYSDLETLYNTSALVPGTFYTITDFRSRQDIPNTADVQLGSIEPLTVQALTDSDLSNLVQSTSNADDLIFYEIDNVDFGADMGRIMYREDKQKDLRAWFDWREFQFRRWESAPASGIFTVTTDNGNAFQDFPAFFAGGISTEIRPAYSGAQIQNNIVIQGSNSQAIRIGSDCVNITFLDGCQNITIGDACSIMTFFDSVTNVEIRSENLILSFGSSCDNIEIGSGNVFVGLGDGVRNTTVGEGCSGITIGDSAVNVSVGNNCVNCSFSNTIRSINLDNGCFAVAANDALSCTVGAGVSSTNIFDVSNATIDAGVTTRTVTGFAGVNQDQQHSMNSLNSYFEIDFATLSAIGTYSVAQLPLGTEVWIMNYRGNNLVSSGGAGASTIELGINTDAPGGLIPAVADNNAVFGGQLNLTPILVPTLATTAIRDVELTIGGADMVSGTLRVWLQTVID